MANITNKSWTGYLSKDIKVGWEWVRKEELAKIIKHYILRCNGKYYKQKLDSVSKDIKQSGEWVKSKRVPGFADFQSMWLIYL